jgi:hypothetical protein
VTDLVVEGATVVSPQGRRVANIAVAEEVIKLVGPNQPAAKSAVAEGGLLVLRNSVEPGPSDDTGSTSERTFPSARPQRRPRPTPIIERTHGLAGPVGRGPRGRSYLHEGPTWTVRWPRTVTGQRLDP